MRFYIDTNIWIDLWSDRMAGIQPVGYYAKAMFDKLINSKNGLVISDFIVRELEVNFPKDLVNERLKKLQELGFLEIVKITKEIFNEGKELSRKVGIPTHDGVHVIIAKKLGLTIITRDKHFEKIKDIVKVLDPGEL